MRLQLILFFLLRLYVPTIHAQTYADSLRGVTLISSDNLGNIYAVIQSEVIKLDQNGNKLFNFSRKDFGPITQIDTRDPLSVHLFYRDFGMLRILDNQLGENTVIDLRSAGLIDPVVIANAVDGGIWVYERVNNQLLKYDNRMQQQLLAIDLFQFEGKPINPVSMMASDNWLILHTENELFLFDRFGNYARKLPLKSPTRLLQPEDQALWSTDSTNILHFNLKLNSEEKFPLPVAEPIQQLRITRQNYWVLLPSGVLKKIPLPK